MPARKSDKIAKPAIRKPVRTSAGPDNVAITLPEAMRSR